MSDFEENLRKYIFGTDDDYENEIEDRSFTAITDTDDWPCCVVYAGSDVTLSYTYVFRSAMGYSIVEYDKFSTAQDCLNAEGYIAAQSVNGAPMVWVRGDGSKAAVYFVPMPLMRKLVESVLSDCFEGQTVLADEGSLD